MEHKFEPFQKVLVRNSEKMWSASFYSHYHKLAGKHCTVTGLFGECIEYTGNEHLLGTTDDPEPEHEYRWGEMVECETEIGKWKKAIYVCYDANLKVHLVIYENRCVIGHATNIRPLKEAEDG